jgi:transposase InsO family protein
MKLNLPRRAKKRVITRERQPLAAPEAVNQTWALDFMHDTLYDGRKFRLLNVIDEGNREALGHRYPRYAWQPLYHCASRAHRLLCEHGKVLLCLYQCE